MRVVCDVELCQGHGRCEAMAPEVYRLDDNGYLVTPVIEVQAGLEEQARIGAESCPEGILVIEE